MSNDKIEQILNYIKKNIDVKKTHLFVGGEIVSSQFTMKKIKDDIKKNYDNPKKNVKGYVITIDLDKNDKNPLSINCTQMTITPTLFIGNKENDNSQTFVYSKKELLKYGFKIIHIKKIIKAVKNNLVSFEKNYISISDIL
jgi:Ni,Fe-hydrogenase maturation factor